MGRAFTPFVGSVIAVSAAVVLSLVSLRGQAGPAGGSLPGAEAVKAFLASQMAKNWTPPKTPWGDPDLQGIFTTKDEANTPFERPDEWAGRRIQDITPKELAEAVVKRQELALETAPFAGGGDAEQGIAIAVPIHWFDNLAAKNSRPWFVIDPPEGKIPPVTRDAASYQPPGRARGAADGRRDSYTDRSNADRCLAQTWRAFATIYGNSYQILQTPDYVVFRREQIHEARMFPIDREPARARRPHVAANIRPYQGDGRAHWDGNTLVVELTNFHENQDFRGYSVKNLRQIERFTRIGPKTVDWSITVDNPSVWSRPWTYSLPLTQDETQLIHEYACHEGNYGMANILTAGRAEDSKAKGR